MKCAMIITDFQLLAEKQDSKKAEEKKLIVETFIQLLCET